MEATLEQLYRQPLLDPLDEEALASILPLIRVERYRVEDEVFREGDPARNFYMISAGEFEVLVNEGGEQRRINLLYPGEFFGDVALLTGEPRGVTVRAVTDSELLYLPGQDFLTLLDEFPFLEQHLEKQARAIEARTQAQFAGQHAGEVVLYYRRRHWMSLVRRMGGVLFFMSLWTAALIVAYLLFRTNLEAQTTATVILLALLIIPALMLAWQFLDWYNDLYIVTNERVIRIEKVIGISNQRFEIPLAKVQNVNVANLTPVGEALGYGKVIVATAAQGAGIGTLVLDYMSDASLVAERMIYEINREKGAASHQAREQKRRALREALGLDPSNEPVPEEAESPPPLEETRTPPPALGAIVMGALRYLRPIMREQKGDTIIWRKHWIILLVTSLPAYLALFALTGGVLALELAFFEQLQDYNSRVVLPLAALLWLFNIAWLAWIYVDWRNDLYILTSDAILDEEKNPLGFNKEVRRAPLDTIQDIRYEQSNPLMVLMNVGHVLIQTAGQQGEFTFDWVKDPREVQLDIFQAMQARLQRRQKEEAAATNQELLELIRLYEEERRRNPTAPPPEPVPKPPSRVDPGDPDSTTRRWG